MVDPFIHFAKMRPMMELDEDYGIYGTETFNEDALTFGNYKGLENLLRRKGRI